MIFTTAYDEYASKRSSDNALDYLLKPIELKRLADAIHKLHQVDEKKAPGASGIRNISWGKTRCS